MEGDWIELPATHPRLEKQEKEKEPELWKKAGKQGSDTDR